MTSKPKDNKKRQDDSDEEDNKVVDLMDFGTEPASKQDNLLDLMGDSSNSISQ